MRKTILILLAAATIAACKKNIPEPSIPTEDGNASLTISNAIQDSVYLNVRGQDIATGTLPHIFNITLAPGASVTMPRSEMESAYRYYYYWHTKDYTYSSWYNTTAAGLPTELFFDYYADTTDYAVTLSGEQRNELKVFLDNDGASSVWMAVDAYDNTNTSVWGTLTDSAKNHKFTISKFHTVKHTFTRLATTEATNTLFFMLPKEADRVSLRAQNPADSFILTTNAAPHATLSTTANDTLFYIHRENGSYVAPYYKLVRTSVAR